MAIFGVSLLHHKRRRSPHFRFDFGRDHHELFQQGELDFGRATFTGSIKNRSLEANSIKTVYLVVWRTKLRAAALHYSFGGHVLDESRQRIGPPLDFRPRSSQAVTILCEFPFTGTVDDQLSTVTQPVRGNPNLLLPRYKYELVFEDVAGNLFDKDGYPRSRRSIDIYCTLDKAWERLKDGDPLPMIRHLARIAWEGGRFGLQRLARVLGL